MPLSEFRHELHFGEHCLAREVRTQRLMRRCLRPAPTANKASTVVQKTHGDAMTVAPQRADTNDAAAHPHRHSLASIAKASLLRETLRPQLPEGDNDP